MKQRRKIYKMLIFSLLLFLIPISGQAIEKFQLYNRCNKINLLVESLPEDAKKINLTREAIINSAESRLRSARIYDRDAYEYLYVNVNVVGKAFSIKTSFKKFAMSYGEMGVATTWSTQGAGTHGGDSSYILSVLPEYFDKFIVEYLRVNEKDCK